MRSKYVLAPLVRALNGSVFLAPCVPRGTLLGLCLTGLFGATAQAQSTGDNEAVALPPVVVTATSRTQPVADVQAAVQVISQRDLQSYPGTSLTEALQLAVGVDARANGANSTLAIRGIITNAGSPVLVLVDGLRRTAKYGGVNLNLIALEDVERIEIVRGPMSALYGADATGGVINVVTKSLTKAAPGSGSVRATLGQTTDHQRDTVAAGATLNFAAAATRHRVSLEQRSRDLYRYNKNAAFADLGKIDQRFLMYQGELVLNEDHRLTWALEHLDQSDKSPGLLAAAPPARPTAQSYEGYEKERRTFGALRYSGRVAGGQLAVDVAQGQSDASTTRAFPTIETTDYRQTQLNARYFYDWGPHALVLGAGQTVDKLNISINSREARRSNEHVLLQDEWRIGGGFSLLAGIREDRFNDFGSVTTPRAALTYRTGPWSVRLGHGEAYRAPSVLEQYSSFLRGRFLIVGDPNLKPETNKTNEIALGFNQRDFSGEVTYFDSKVDNLIQSVSRPREASDPASVQSRSQYANVAQARLKGVEVQGQWRITPHWSTQLGLDYLDATDESTGARLTQRSRVMARLGVAYTRGAWRVDFRTRHYSGYWNADPAIRGSAPFNSSYGTADLRLEYRATKALALALGIDNLSDKRQPINWSSTGATMDPPARFVYLNARYSF